MLSTKQIGWTLLIHCLDCNRDFLQHCTTKKVALENIFKFTHCDGCGSDNIAYQLQRGQHKLSEVKDKAYIGG